MNSGGTPTSVDCNSETTAIGRLYFIAFSPLTAHTYEACFDEILEDCDCDAPVEEEPLCAPHSSCAPTSLSLSLHPQNLLLEDHVGPALLPECPAHKDSGTGAELIEQEVTGNYGRMPSSGRNSDSGT